MRLSSKAINGAFLTPGTTGTAFLESFLFSVLTMQNETLWRAVSLTPVFIDKHARFCDR